MRPAIRYLAPAVPIAAAIMFAAATIGSAASHATAHPRTTDPAKQTTGPVHAPGTPSLACPMTDRGAVKSTVAGADSSLVPAGAVSLTLCRYNGLNPGAGAPAFGLRGIGATGGAELRKLVRGLDAIPPTPPGTAYSCPFDDGSAIVASFSYATAGRDVVRVGVEGCNPVTNGQISRLGLDRPVIGRLKRLVKHVQIEWPAISGRIKERHVMEPMLCTVKQCPICPTNCREPTRVVALSSDGKAAAEAKLHDNRFHLTFAKSGRYALKLEHVDKVLARKLVRVHAGHTAKVIFHITLG